MIDCAYCERPLMCDACQAPYAPPSREHYEALGQPEVKLDCPECGAVLVCRWCKTPYDGLQEDDDRGEAPAG